jgi:hypothetical protein
VSTTGSASDAGGSYTGAVLRENARFLSITSSFLHIRKEIDVELTGTQREQLQQALLSAFPGAGPLAMMVSFKLNENLAIVAGSGPLGEVAFNLIIWAEAQGKLVDLINGAHEQVPGNPKLLAFAREHLPQYVPPPRQELESIIVKGNSFLDVAQWRTRLMEVEGQVCRVEIAANLGTVYGTGFLVGRDVVMTNYHVVEAIILGAKGQTTAKGLAAQPGDVVLRFDYKRLADGTTLHPGTEFRLTAGEWLIDASPPGPAAGSAPDQLDYALLRVQSAPGDQLPGGQQAAAPAAKRGWVRTDTPAYAFAVGSPLYIMQHPEGAPLQLAIDTEAVVGTTDDGRRVRYQTNTLKGSSGSPCFNKDWQLVAIHHRGDPNFDAGQLPSYNQGIPISAIRDLVTQRGLAAELG